MPNSGQEERHPIQVVSRRTGLTPELLRAWERRYQAVLPARSPGNRRFYTDSDIARLLLLRGLIDAGRSIKQIAHLPTTELERLLSEDREAVARAGGPRRSKRVRRAGDRTAAAAADESPGAATIEGYLDLCLDAVRRLDGPEFEATLARAHLAFGRIAFIEQLLVPLLHRIGDLWQSGSLRVMHEHLTSAIVRTVLGQIVGHSRVRPEAPLLVMATPSGQGHELGALVVVATAAAEGWRVLYLGPDLPAEEIAAAARQRGADAVALSIEYPADDPRLHEQLAQLHELLPPGVPLLVGGPASHAYGATLEAIEAVLVPDIASLRQALQERVPSAAN